MNRCDMQRRREKDRYIVLGLKDIENLWVSYIRRGFFADTGQADGDLGVVVILGVGGLLIVVGGMNFEKRVAMNKSIAANHPE